MSTKATQTQHVALKHAPKDAVKREFAKRLQERLFEKGWSSADLARHAGKFTGKDHFERSNISKYISGESIPRDKHLRAICGALGCKPEDLLPRNAATAGDHVPIEVRDAGNGNAWLRLEVALPWPKVTEVMNIIHAHRVE